MVRVLTSLPWPELVLDRFQTKVREASGFRDAFTWTCLRRNTLVSSLMPNFRRQYGPQAVVGRRPCTTCGKGDIQRKGRGHPTGSSVRLCTSCLGNKTLLPPLRVKLIITVEWKRQNGKRDPQHWQGCSRTGLGAT